MQITVTHHASGNPNTIWNRLAVQLGREPTNAEAAMEVLRILSEAKTERIAPKRWNGKTARQRVGGTFGS